MNFNHGILGACSMPGVRGIPLPRHCPQAFGANLPIPKQTHVASVFQYRTSRAGRNSPDDVWVKFSETRW